MLFDSCAFWGHNEADLGTWRAARYNLGAPFFKEYRKKMGVSEPKEDWDDRNALYAPRYDLPLSAMFREEPKFRNMAMAEMQRLVDKYPNGYEGEDKLAVKTLKPKVSINEIIPQPTLETGTQIIRV